VQKTTPGITQRQADVGKWCRESRVSLALLVRRVITAEVAYMCSSSINIAVCLKTSIIHIRCDLDLLTPKQMSFKDSSWHICMSSLVIISYWDIVWNKNDKQQWKTYPVRQPSASVTKIESDSNNNKVSP